MKGLEKGRALQGSAVGEDRPGQKHRLPGRRKAGMKAPRSQRVDTWGGMKMEKLSRNPIRNPNPRFRLYPTFEAVLGIRMQVGSKLCRIVKVGGGVARPRR